MNRSEQLDKIASALSKAQGAFPILQKRSKAYNYMYADLAEILECVKVPLAENGLSVINQIEWESNPPTMTTMLLHDSGQWLSVSMKLFFKADGKVNEMQALGSCITYSKRYSISCLLNLAADKESDDDGVKAAPRAEPNPPAKIQSVVKPDITPEEAIAALIESPIEIPDMPLLVDYMKVVQAKAKRENRRLDGILANWLANPTPFLESFTKFCIDHKLQNAIPLGM